MDGWMEPSAPKNKKIGGGGKVTQNDSVARVSVGGGEAARKYQPKGWKEEREETKTLVPYHSSVVKSGGDRR